MIFVPLPKAKQPIRTFPHNLIRQFSVQVSTGPQQVGLAFLHSLVCFLRGQRLGVCFSPSPPEYFKQLDTLHSSLLLPVGSTAPPGSARLRSVPGRSLVFVHVDEMSHILVTVGLKQVFQIVHTQSLDIHSINNI